MSNTVHECRPGHAGILADDCERCMHHAEHPFAGVDATKLRRLVALATHPDRLDVAETEADLIACKQILDTIDHVGRLMEVAVDIVVADLRDRWGAPIALRA